MATPLVYADFHNADAQGRLRLNCVGTLEDLAQQKIELRDGLLLTLYADDVDASDKWTNCWSMAWYRSRSRNTAGWPASTGKRCAMPRTRIAGRPTASTSRPCLPGNQREARILVDRYPCPCCGYLTLGEEPPGTFEICEICGWEDDRVQCHDPTYQGGANGPSLNEARNNFLLFGASCREDIKRVRAPRDNEIPSNRDAKDAE